MIKKEVVSVISISCILGLFYYQSYCQEPSTTVQEGREPLSQASKQWLEEVVPYIITSAEKEIFLNLRTEEDRGKFIDGFWKKRDPNPQTEENEFKLEYYKRIALANKFFGAGGMDGWRTERGKICILLGPPNEIQRDLNPAGTSSAMAVGARETWNYWGLSDPGLPYNLEFTFVDRTGTGHYKLETGLSLDEQGGRPLDTESLHYYFDTLEYLAQAMRNPFENLDKLRGVITTQVSYDHIPLQPEWMFHKETDGRSRMTLLVGVPCSSATGKRIGGNDFYSLTLLINVSDNLGRLILEKSKDYNFKHAPAEVVQLKDRAFELRYPLMFEPASYKLHLLVLDNFSGKIGTFHQEISFPDFGGDQIKMSDIILSVERGEKKVGEAEEIKEGSSEPREDREISRVFRIGEEMNASFEIYNLSLDPKTGLNAFRVEYLFFQNETMLTQVPAAKTESTGERDCRVRTSFRLKNFKHGQYLLRIKAVDANSGDAASKDAPFNVTE